MKRHLVKTFIFGFLLMTFIGCKKNSSSTDGSGEPFFKWSIDNTNYTGGGSATYQNASNVDLISINAVDNSSQGNLVSIQLNGKNSGTYNFGDITKGGSGIIFSVNGSPSYSTVYSNCQSTQNFYASGSVTITNWNAPGGWVEGTFSGKAIGHDFNCQTPNFHSISGSFKIKRAQ